MSNLLSATRGAFFDTNIWLYAFIDDQDPRKAQIAKELIQTTSHITISVQVINEVCANIIRTKLMDELGIRTLIDTFYVKYTVIDHARHLLREASTLREQLSVSYWDSLIITAALLGGCTQVYSEDMQDGQRIRDQLTIVNPFKLKA